MMIQLTAYRVYGHYVSETSAAECIPPDPGELAWEREKIMLRDYAGDCAAIAAYFGIPAWEVWQLPYFTFAVLLEIAGGNVNAPSMA